MDHVSYSAIAVAIALLIVIWVFLVRMILSKAPDARLPFLIDLMGEEEDRSASSAPRGPSPCLPGDPGMKTLHEMTRSAGNETKRHSAQHFRPDVPLLFATSLRGRGL
ncbi:MAG: hypothetical protein WAO35_13930 [Terriglobia bacterium]